jgi:hypothetical protein
MYRVSDYAVPYPVAPGVTLIYMQQVKYILTFMEIKSYYSSFETGKKANKNYAQRCGGNYNYLIKHYQNYILQLCYKEEGGGRKPDITHFSTKTSLITAAVTASSHCITAAVTANAHCIIAAVNASAHCITAAVTASAHCITAAVTASAPCTTAAVYC